LAKDHVIALCVSIVAAAATAMNVGKSTMDKWVRQLKERAGKSPIASPMTPEQIEMRELKKKLQRVEMVSGSPEPY